MRCFPKKNLSCDNQFQLDFGKNELTSETAISEDILGMVCLRFVKYQPKYNRNSFGGHILRLLLILNVNLRGN